MFQKVAPFVKKTLHGKLLLKRGCKLRTTLTVIILLLQVFRLLQGETDENQIRLLQKATETSIEAATAWYKKECIRQQLQDQCLSHIHLLEGCRKKYPTHAAEIEIS